MSVRAKASKTFGGIIDFTLVELLVVVGVIAILMSLLLPSLKSAMETAKKINCAGNLSQLGLGYAMYINDYGYTVPPVAPGSGRWFYTPLAPDYVLRKPGSSASKIPKSPFRCPSDRNPIVKSFGTEYYDCSYGLNGRISSQNLSSSQYGKRYQKVVFPSMCLLICDFKQYYAISYGNAVTDGDPRHNAGTEILWLDNHATWWKGYICYTDLPGTVEQGISHWIFWWGTRYPQYP